LLIRSCARFHPAIQRVKEIIDSGELGNIKSVSTTMTTPQGFIKDGDIRLIFSLGGGSMMDMGGA
jgi:predicted dehydrogenase